MVVVGVVSVVLVAIVVASSKLVANLIVVCASGATLTPADVASPTWPLGWLT